MDKQTIVTEAELHAALSEPRQFMPAGASIKSRWWGVLAAIFAIANMAVIIAGLWVAPENPNASLVIDPLSLGLIFIGGGILSIPNIVFCGTYLRKVKPKGLKLGLAITSLVIAFNALTGFLLMLAFFGLIVFAK